MSIYVDEVTEYPEHMIKRVARKYGQFWSHMATDGDLEELHQFAQEIGLKLAWFQHHHKVPHYDLTPTNRQKAVQNGAVEVSAKDLFKRCRLNQDSQKGTRL